MSTSRSRRRPEDGSPPEPEATSPGEQETGVEPAEELPAAEPPGDEPNAGTRWTARSDDLPAAQPPTEEPPTEEPPGEEPAEELPEGVYTAKEPAGPCRMCSSPIDVEGQYMVLNMGRRVHYGACSDQARAAGYMGRIEPDAGPA